MSDPELSYADRVLREAMVSVGGGLDLDLASRGISEALGAVVKIAEELNRRPFAPRVVKVTCECGKTVSVTVASKPEELARAMAHAAKVVDELKRLSEFAKGQPDSRPGDARGAGRDVLKLLTDEQLGVVTGWLAEAERRGAA